MLVRSRRHVGSARGCGGFPEQGNKEQAGLGRRRHRAQRDFPQVLPPSAARVVHRGTEIGTVAMGRRVASDGSIVADDGSASGEGGSAWYLIAPLVAGLLFGGRGLLVGGACVAAVYWTRGRAAAAGEAASDRRRVVHGMKDLPQPPAQRGG